MYLFAIEDAATRALRLANLRERILHRLGDSDGKVWSDEEVEDYIARGAEELVAVVNLVWDQTFLENLPHHFSYTNEWEVPTFDFGQANYTAEFEAELAEENDIWYADDVNRGIYTDPSAVTLLNDVLASTDIPALAKLPDRLTEIDRVTFDGRTINATTHARAKDLDARYERTRGEVEAYTWRKDGERMLRKIRVPVSVSDGPETDGSWGVARNVADLTDAPPDGTWGVPRRVPGRFPIGDSEGWGVPRRFYDEHDNVKLEYFRQFTIHDQTDSELPDHYFFYLADFAQWKCLIRNGPGQDMRLAAVYEQRWTRNVSRLQDRVRRQFREKAGVFGRYERARGVAPPSPRLPWQYGSRTR